MGQNDWTVSWCNRVVQLSERHQTLRLARKKIMVSELLGGTLRVTYRGRALTWQELPSRPPRAARKPTTATKPKPRYKPPANHSWRRGLNGR